MKPDLLKRLAAAKARPDIAKSLDPQELTIAFAELVSFVQTLNKAVEAGRLNGRDGQDGRTPLPDSDYMSLATAKRFFDDLKGDFTEAFEAERVLLINAVEEKLNAIRDGEDGVVTDAEIERAARIASSLIELPDFEKFKELDSDKVREAFGDISIQDVTGLEDALNQIAAIRSTPGGTIGKQQVYSFIRQAVADGTIPAGGEGGTDDQVASEVPFTPNGDIAATNVQTAIVELRDDTDTKLSAKVNTSAVGSANGVASLDGAGKVPVGQLPNSIMEYQGTWNATTNTPTLADGAGNTGDVYRVTVSGSQDLGSGSISFDVGDYAIYNGSTWEKSDTTDSVASVNSKTGIVVLDPDDLDDTSATHKFATAAQLSKVDAVNTIVGTTETQTVTNKDVTSATNKLRDSKTIAIESPTATEDISFFFTNKAITITEIRAVLVGSATPSVTWTLRHGTDRSAAGAEVVTSGTTTTSTTTGSDVTSFNDATIVADSHVWVETTAQSGTVNSLVLTVFYTED